MKSQPGVLLPSSSRDSAEEVERIPQHTLRPVPGASTDCLRDWKTGEKTCQDTFPWEEEPEQVAEACWIVCVEAQSKIEDSEGQDHDRAPRSWKGDQQGEFWQWLAKDGKGSDLGPY